jgi:DNA-directed RNA polymerase specialized sigma24 family protein
MEAGDADAQLMLRYAAGETRAFDELYALHRSGLWRFIRRSVRDAAATDDVFQECWSRVITNRARSVLPGPVPCPQSAGASAPSDSFSLATA